MYLYIHVDVSDILWSAKSRSDEIQDLKAVTRIALKEVRFSEIMDSRMIMMIIGNGDYDPYGNYMELIRKLWESVWKYLWNIWELII